MSRTITHSCDRCGAPAKDASGRITHREVGLPSKTEHPSVEERPTFDVTVIIKMPGQDNEQADLCAKCQVQLLEATIATIQVPSFGGQKP